MCALELLQPTDLARRRHVDRRPMLPPQLPLAHLLPPPREHERVNVEGRGNRLHLYPALPTQPHGGELELRTVFLNLLRTRPGHSTLPSVRGRCRPASWPRTVGPPR